MELKTCPFCQEDIKVGALKCKHCGSMLVDIGLFAFKGVEKI